MVFIGDIKITGSVALHMKTAPDALMVNVNLEKPHFPHVHRYEFEFNPFGLYLKVFHLEPHKLMNISNPGRVRSDKWRSAIQPTALWPAAPQEIYEANTTAKHL